MEIKNIPFNPNEKGILLLRGFSLFEADEIIGELRRSIEKGEPSFFIWTPDVSIEFIKTEDIVDIKAEPKLGDKAICEACNKPIIYVGPYWKHQGKLKPRHPAIPKDDDEKVTS